MKSRCAVRVSALSLLCVLVALTASGPATAAPALKVAVSIKPLHSLVAAVMAGVGAPHLIVAGGASPHTYQMKPSDARAVSEADVVVWAGEGLETFLQKPLATLARHARIVAMTDMPGMVRLAYRAGGVWGEGDGGHIHVGTDPHLWLDPVNAKALVKEIAKILGDLDPAHAAVYRDNAAKTATRLDVLTHELDAMLRPLRGRPYLVFHDAFQYFETRFRLDGAGALSVEPEVAPGARRIVQLRETVRARGVSCVFAEPEFRPSLVRLVREGTNARAGILDPLGADLAAGPKLYFTLMRANAHAMADCLSPKRDGKSEASNRLKAFSGKACPRA